METYKIIGKRFLKGFLSGGIAMASVITLNNVHNWTDLAHALSSLTLTFVIGGGAASIV